MHSIPYSSFIKLYPCMSINSFLCLKQQLEIVQNSLFFILHYSNSPAMFHYFPIIFWFHLLLFSPSLSLQSPPATIPAFLQQSDVSSGCTLHLSDELFTGINDACTATKNKANSPELHHSRCCPVLAAWLYTAYSDTALGKVSQVPEKTSDLPMLPDESETCVKNLEKGLKYKGMNLVKPNASCDLVYCYCGITLHPLSCPESFFVSPKTGKLVGDSSVKKLEKNCLSTNRNRFIGLDECSNCLNTLYLVRAFLFLFVHKSLIIRCLICIFFPFVIYNFFF